MFNFLKLCVSTFKVFNGHQNAELPSTCISLTLTPGVNGIANFDGRDCDLIATFNSYSLDQNEAYNNLFNFRETFFNEYKILEDNGFFINYEKMENIKDLSFLKNLENCYRFSWSVIIDYRVHFYNNFDILKSVYNEDNINTKIINTFTEKGGKIM